MQLKGGSSIKSLSCTQLPRHSVGPGAGGENVHFWKSILHVQIKYRAFPCEKKHIPGISVYLDEGQMGGGKVSGWRERSFTLYLVETSRRPAGSAGI